MRSFVALVAVGVLFTTTVFGANRTCFYDGDVMGLYDVIYTTDAYGDPVKIYSVSTLVMGLGNARVQINEIVGGQEYVIVSEYDQGGFATAYYDVQGDDPIKNIVHYHYHNGRLVKKCNLRY